MTWTGKIFSVGAILTAADQNNLQADITAHANGDSGAPKQLYAGMTFSNNIVQSDLANNSVGQGEIVANSIGQSELKDALQQNSGESSSNISFTGGAYTLGWAMSGSDIEVHGHTTSSHIWGIRAAVISGTYYFQAQYFQASPPYNLGYGNIPLFIFALIDNVTREIVAVDTAPDAPWHYNGPTDIRAKLYKDGIAYRYCKPVELELRNNDTSILLPNERAEIVNRLKQERPESLLEITQDIKNADIDIIPHPFIGTDLTDKTVVLLDPCSDLCEELFLMREVGENTNDLLMNGNFVLDNSPLDVRSPIGVITTPFKWKLTK